MEGDSFITSHLSCATLMFIVLCWTWQALREQSSYRRAKSHKHHLDLDKKMEAEGSTTQRKRSKFSDKPDVVEEKTEVELKIEEPAIKVEVKVEENGVEEKTFDQEDINKVVEGDMATAGDLEMEVKIEKANGIEESEKSVKDADTEMSEAPATTEPAVKVRCIF